MNEKQYAERDIMELDELGGYYTRHVMAMTGENLHSKSDIAAELAFRDMQIEKMREDLNDYCQLLQYHINKQAELQEKLRRSEDYCIGVDSERMDYIEKCQKLTAENVALKCPELQELLRLVECMSGDYCDGNYGHSQEWIRHIVAQQNEYQDKFGDTPYGIASGSKYLVTDVAANALRAEGGAKALEDFAQFNIKCIGINDEYEEHLREVARAARVFANQLREGK